MKWFRKHKRHIEWEKLCDWLTDLKTKPHKIIVGTDSQPVRDGEIFASVICILSPTSHFDRCYFYQRELRCKHSHTLYDRMFAEAMTTIEIAERLKREISESLNIELHLDLASTPKGKTFKYSQGLMSMAKGFNYSQVEIKPNSWAASCIADKFSKPSKNLKFSRINAYAEEMYTEPLHA